MFELNKYKKIIKKYPYIFENIISDYKLDTLVDNKLYFKSKSGNTLKITFDKKDSEMVTVTAEEVKDNYLKKTNFSISKRNQNTGILVKETVVEARQRGAVVEIVRKKYDTIEYSKDMYNVVSLTSKRYVLGMTLAIPNFEDEEQMKLNSKLTTYFSSHINSYSLISDAKEANNIVEFNGSTISNLYATIKGPNQVEITYDLYNGTISKSTEKILLNIKEESLSEDAYDYKNLVGITEQENRLVGPRKIDSDYEEKVQAFFREKILYSKPIDINNRAVILAALKYKPTAVETAKRFIERLIEMPYEEFDKLDFDAQQELINLAREKNKLTLSKKMQPKSIVNESFMPVEKQLNGKDSIKEKVKSIFRKN